MTELETILLDALERLENGLTESLKVQNEQIEDLQKQLQQLTLACEQLFDLLQV